MPIKSALPKESIVTKKNILLAATTGFSQLELCDTNLEKGSFNNRH